MESLGDEGNLPGGTYAPIALFAYNRVAHLQKTVEALSSNAEASASELYIFSDAPKASRDTAAVHDVRKYINEITGFSRIKVIERPENFGLAKSIIAGVTQVCNEHDRIIVLEDDMVASRFFLKYMNDALNLYGRDERVISVHGYVYPIEQILPESWFLRAAHCWGWATWGRGWRLFEPSGQRLLAELVRRKLTTQFDFEGSFPYTKMLRDQIAGRNDSWAIRWYASAFLQDKLTLYPGRSLVYNTGMDGSGTHCSATDHFSNGVAEDPISLRAVDVTENVEARRAIAAFFKQHRRALPVRVGRKLNNYLRKMFQR